MYNYQTQYVSCLNALIDLLKDTPFSSETLQRIQSDIEATTFFIPIMGAFSSGKSSLLNALIGEPVLAIGITAETEVATELHYSTTPHILAVRHDQTTQHFELNQLDLVQKQTKDWKAIKIYLNNSVLKSLEPLVLVDMPGFGTSEGSNQAAATYYIKKATHAFVLVSAEHGTVSTLLMEQLEQIKSMRTNFSVILSKCNLKAPSEINELSNYISTELAQAFDTDTHLVAMVGLDDISTQLTPILKQINPDDFIKQSYLSAMQNANNEILSLISFKKSNLDKNEINFVADIKSIKKDISTLKFNQNQLKTDTDFMSSSQFISHQVSQVIYELKKNKHALAKDFVNRGCQFFYLSDSIISIVKTTLNHKIEERINEFGNDLLQQYTSQLANTELEFLREKIVSDEKKRQQGVLSILYKSIEKIVSSIQKLLPIFVSNLVRDYQEQQINIKLEQELFPEIKVILQQNLGQALTQQLNAISTQISESIVQQLEQKQTLLEQLQQTKSKADVDLQQQKEKLTELETNLYNISQDVLY